MINVTDNIKPLLLPDGTLPVYAWPGGYPIYYADRQGNILCFRCANDNDETDPPIAAHDCNWESLMHCDGCSEQIEAAYDIVD